MPVGNKNYRSVAVLVVGGHY